MVTGAFGSRGTAGKAGGLTALCSAIGHLQASRQPL